jgi:hypothetical protein
MLRYEREIEELLAELELREQCDRHALLPPPPYGLPGALRRPFPPAPKVHTGVPLVGVLLMLVGVLLGGTLSQWAILIGAVLLSIAAASFRLAPRVFELPMDIHLYRVPPHRY